MLFSIFIGCHKIEYNIPIFYHYDFFCLFSQEQSEKHMIGMQHYKDAGTTMKPPNSFYTWKGFMDRWNYEPSTYPELLDSKVRGTKTRQPGYDLISTTFMCLPTIDYMFVNVTPSFSMYSLSLSHTLSVSYSLSHTYILC